MDCMDPPFDAMNPESDFELSIDPDPLTLTFVAWLIARCRMPGTGRLGELSSSASWVAVDVQGGLGEAPSSRVTPLADCCGPPTAWPHSTLTHAPNRPGGRY